MNNNEFQVVDDSNSQNIDYQEINTNSTSNKKGINKKVIIIILAVVVLAVIGFFVIRFITNRNYEEESLATYQRILTSASNSYYETIDELPVAYGDCKTVTLQSLIDNNLITDTYLRNSCDASLTTVKVCKLRSGSYHHTITFSCNDDYLTTTYTDWVLGSESNLIENESDVRFTYLIKTTDLSSSTASGDEEVFMENQIPYEQTTYEVVSEKTLYRFRNRMYTWYKLTKYYYPNDGIYETSVNEYYLTAPNETYNNKGSSATVYKWLIGRNQAYNNGEYVSEAEYPYTVKGAEGTPIVWATLEYPQTKSYRKIEAGYIYRSRTLESSDIVTSVIYRCDNNGSYYESDIPCSNIVSYKCAWKNSVSDKVTTSTTWQDTECKNIHYYTNQDVNDGYSTSWSTTNCSYSATADPYLCDRRTGYIVTDKVWKWYTPSERVYFQTNNEETYYKVSPSSQAIKDQTTETTAYTWYKSVKEKIGVASTAPSDDAIKGEYSYSSWSNWQETPVVATTDNQVEEQKQVTIKRITDESTVWKNLSNDYLSLEEAIQLLKDNGYEVNSLEDIYNDKSITYEVQINYRNIK